MIDKIGVVNRLKEISNSISENDNDMEFEVVLVDCLENIITHITTNGEYSIEG